MSLALRQATAATLLLGPFIDDTDGKTAETALAISQADVRLSKNGGAPAQKNDATAATHAESGYYSTPINATDTDTAGRLRVMVSKAGALPVWVDCLVLVANVYDALVAGTDALEVDATLWKGATAPAMTGDAFARIGAAGAGLTALGDARLAYLDVPVSSRAASVGGGSGANTVTVTVTGGGSPLEGASVRLTKAGISYVLVTDASGVAVFGLDAGTYALAVSLAGWTASPTTVVVDGAEAVSAAMTQVVIPAPTEPDTCVCWLYARDQAGAAVADVDVLFRIERVTGSGAAFDGDALTVTSAADGLVQAQLPVGAQVAVQWYGGQWRRFAVPDDTDFELPSIIV